jgi:hypothetical protein
VWFSGVHSGIGGGYPESESGLSKKLYANKAPGKSTGWLRRSRWIRDRDVEAQAIAGKK